MIRQIDSSCFVSKLRNFLDLTEEEQAAVATFERTERSLKSGETVFREGDAVTELFVVRSGWLCSIRHSETGQRQVLQLRHPGDMCGMHDQLLNARSYSLMALEPCVVCPFPLHSLRELMTSAPRVSLLINALIALDQVVQFDLVQAIARSSASDRLLHLLLHLLCRLKINNRNMDKTFRLPMNQALLGDLLGLTNVTVSKSMTELERRGVISRSDGTVTILNYETAVHSIGFVNRISELDLKWLL